MEFSVNSPIIFAIVGIIVLLVVAQSVFFLIKAIKRSKEIGMDQKKIKKTMMTAAIFTIAPAVAIVIGVITLSKALGVALPWLRLSVIGSLTYESVAAANALSPMGYHSWNINSTYCKSICHCRKRHDHQYFSWRMARARVRQEDPKGNEVARK